MKKHIIIFTLLLLTIVITIIFIRKSKSYNKFNSSIEITNTFKEKIENPKSESQVYFETYPRVAVKNLWIEYEDKIQDDGRTIDRSRDYLTTSEGQSYSLLRAVWMDDKKTFDQVLKWTNNNLRKRPNDKLFAWKWGENPDGTWDVMYDEGGINTATDSDQDIALALIFASKRWDEDKYMDQAIEILNDIWEVEVLTINDKHYLTAGNWAVNEEYPTINPSYFSFAAYDIFNEVNPENPWIELKNNSYDILEKSTYGNLNTDSSANLPPDWISIDPITGEIVDNFHSDKTTNFDDDAIRVYWRVALDWYWHENQRAYDYLSNTTGFLSNEWDKNSVIYSEYKHDGEPVTSYDSYSLYGTFIPALKIINKDKANEMYHNKLTSLYDVDLETFKEDNELGYYSQNWVWFGIALYEDLLPDLYNEIK